MALGASGCAHATRPVVLEPPAGASVSRLSDLPSMHGAYVVVLLRSGESVWGAVETIDGSILALRVTEDGLTTRRVAEEEIVCLARRVGRSTTARSWLGALIGATASVPFGISMASDMMMPAAIAGALIAGNTGQPRARVLLDRSHLAARERLLCDVPGGMTDVNTGASPREDPRRPPGNPFHDRRSFRDADDHAAKATPEFDRALGHPRGLVLTIDIKNR